MSRPFNTKKEVNTHRRPNDGYKHRGWASQHWAGGGWVDDAVSAGIQQLIGDGHRVEGYRWPSIWCKDWGWDHKSQASTLNCFWMGVVQVLHS
ncbi:hypothetical protein T07_8751 [Trichinella nelsoni]|uniref:Uncharacterized protein n=1 Tax=Trichinella nelsoni TaxID=6336 RepID=A0A0V0RHA5_9BILA|nr:hypothetical protein T07_8751 [Trichinella nelsoni]